VPEQVARDVLDRLTSVGLINDAVFARDWVASRQRRRHLSRSALKRELGVKGVAREDIDAALETVDADAEFASALDLAQRKQGSWRVWLRRCATGGWPDCSAAGVSVRGRRAACWPRCSARTDRGRGGLTGPWLGL
jgi:hypothetical protein